MKSKIYSNPNTFILAGIIGLAVTLTAFWDFSRNRHSLGNLSTTYEGISTCWGRISQTFTAVMIKETQSPYLNRGFMAISDECFGEVIKNSSFLKKYLGRKFETYPSLVSDVSWFHEDVLKVHGSMLSGKNLLSSDKLVDRYGKMENLKIKATDDIESAIKELRTLTTHDQFVIGGGLFLIVLSISFLGIKMYHDEKLRNAIENEALNLLSLGQAKTGALIDTVVIKGLRSNRLKITEQIFRDYHENILEIMSVKSSVIRTQQQGNLKVASIEKAVEEKQIESFDDSNSKSSLREVLASIENLHSDADLQITDFRDALVEIESDACEQIFNSAITKLKEKRVGLKRIMLANQIHSDRVVVNFYLGGSTFNSSELEFLDDSNKTIFEQVDMNLMVLKELASESNVKLLIENKLDKNGKVSGLALKLIFKRVSKEKSKLVSLVKGRKKELSKNLATNH